MFRIIRVYGKRTFSAIIKNLSRQNITIPTTEVLRKDASKKVTVRLEMMIHSVLKSLWVVFPAACCLISSSAV
jgi:hypothetical protein